MRILAARLLCFSEQGGCRAGFFCVHWEHVIGPGIYDCNRQISAVYRKYAYPCHTRAHANSQFSRTAARLGHCTICKCSGYGCPGVCEVHYLIFQRSAGWGKFRYFFSAVILANMLRGVILVAMLNYSQTCQSCLPDRDCSQLELTWKE